MSHTFLAEVGPKRPRHVVMYSRSGVAALRNVHTDRDGRLLIIALGGEQRSMRLDFSQYVEEGERVAAVECTGVGLHAGVAYSGTDATVHFTTPGGDPAANDAAHGGISPSGAEIQIRVMFSTGEQLVERIRVVSPNRIEQGAGFQFTRGSV